MKRQRLTWITGPEIEVAILPTRKPSPILQLAEARAKHRKMRIALPLPPRRHLCLTNQAVLAALREAELAGWQATGGDVLRSVHATQIQP
jgi:hypothetical protein